MPTRTKAKKIPPTPSTTALIAIVKQTRKEFCEIYREIPQQHRNEGQRLLMKKHGSPYQFAKAVSEVIGEISVDEAQMAVEKYLMEWHAA